MTFDNLERALCGFTRRKPFRPFFIEFFTGERLLVKHPEGARIENQLVTFISPNKKYRLFDCESVCQLLDVE